MGLARGMRVANQTTWSSHSERFLPAIFLGAAVVLSYGTFYFLAGCVRKDVVVTVIHPRAAWSDRARRGFLGYIVRVDR